MEAAIVLPFLKDMVSAIRTTCLRLPSLSNLPFSIFIRVLVPRRHAYSFSMNK